MSARASLLLAPTPSSWFEAAAPRWRELLVDHANCEKKAASSALSLMFAYPADMALADRMSRLAREELRHFEQVQKLMRELQVPFLRLSPSRYAEGLRAALARSEPQRLIDLLLCGALIEARSCERFEGLAPRLPAPLSSFYAGLAVAEARHHALYLRLAEQRAQGIGEDMGADKDFDRDRSVRGGSDDELRGKSGRTPRTAAAGGRFEVRSRRSGDVVDWRARLHRLAQIEAELATSADRQFRFHSGRPVEVAPAWGAPAGEGVEEGSAADEDALACADPGPGAGEDAFACGDCGEAGVAGKGSRASSNPS